MRCLICGCVIKNMPVPIRIIEFTPVVPYIPGITENKLGSTILTDRFCCRECYRDIKQHDQEIVEEVEVKDVKRH